MFPIYSLIFFAFAPGFAWCELPFEVVLQSGFHCIVILSVEVEMPHVEYDYFVGVNNKVSGLVFKAQCTHSKSSSLMLNHLFMGLNTVLKQKSEV